MAQQPKYDFFITLGCFGYNVDDFIICGSVENVILKVHSGLYDYNKMMDYFDSCRLFDRPLLEYNAIRQFIHNLNDRFQQINRPLWLPRRYEAYGKFVIDHRNCGLMLKLVLPQSDQETEPEQKRLLIKPTQPFNQLRRVK